MASASPRDWLDWADLQGLSVHENFRTEVANLPVTSARTVANTEPVTLWTPERKELALAMMQELKAKGEKAYDLLRLTIDPITMTVRVHPDLLSHAEYAMFEGKALAALPDVDLSTTPAHHWSRTNNWTKPA